MIPNPKFPIHLTGAGGRIPQDGKHNGLPYQKHQNHVVNLFAVDVLRVALQDTNVSRLPLNAFSCVPVRGNVQLIHDHNSLLNTVIIV